MDWDQYYFNSALIIRNPSQCCVLCNLAKGDVAANRRNHKRTVKRYRREECTAIAVYR